MGLILKHSPPTMRILKELIKNKEHFVLGTFLVTNILLVTGLVSSFRWLLFVLAFITLLLWRYFKNLFISIFLITIFTLPIFTPNKYYVVEIIRGHEFLEPIYQDGYFLGYGVNAANIFLALSFIVFIREIIVRKNLKKIIRFIPILILIITGLPFLTVAILTSIIHSPFPEASLVWAFQYFQMFIVSFLVFYFYRSHKQHFTLLYPTFISMILLEGLLTISQFMSQSYRGLPIESGTGTFFATGLDEINTLFRPSGTLAFHNELALLTLITTIIIIPFMFYKKSKIYFLGSILSLVIIVLTQSRSVWVATIIAGISTIKIYKQHVIHIVTKIGKLRSILYSGILAFLLSLIIVPRTILTMNTTYEGAGLPIRIKLLSEGFRSLVESPWIGFGVGTNEYVLHSFFPDGVMRVFPTAIHMGLLQLSLEVGIVGLLLFIFPFIYIFRVTLNKLVFFKKNLNDESKLFLFPFIVGSISFFVYYLFLPHVGIIEFTYLGIILGFGLIAIFTLQTS